MSMDIKEILCTLFSIGTKKPKKWKQICVQTPIQKFKLGMNLVLFIELRKSLLIFFFVNDFYSKSMKNCWFLTLIFYYNPWTIGQISFDRSTFVLCEDITAINSFFQNLPRLLEINFFYDSSTDCILLHLFWFFTTSPDCRNQKIRISTVVRIYMNIIVCKKKRVCTYIEFKWISLYVSKNV